MKAYKKTYTGGVKMKEVIRTYQGEFGTFIIDLYNGKVIEDGLDRDKIWNTALLKEKQNHIDAYKEQRYIFLKLFDQIFTEDLIEQGIEWDWYFATFGAEFKVRTPAKQYKLVVDAEGTFIYTEA